MLPPYAVMVNQEHCCGSTVEAQKKIPHWTKCDLLTIHYTSLYSQQCAASKKEKENKEKKRKKSYD